MRSARDVVCPRKSPENGQLFRSAAAGSGQPRQWTEARARDDRGYNPTLRNAAGTGNTIWSDCPSEAARVDRATPTRGAPSALPHHGKGDPRSPREAQHPAAIRKSRRLETLCTPSLPTCLSVCIRASGQHDMARNLRLFFAAVVVTCARPQTWFGRRRVSTCFQLEPRSGDQHTPAFVTVIRQPGAFLPLTISFTALALVLLHLAIYGVVRETDEVLSPISGSSSWLDRCPSWCCS